MCVRSMHGLPANRLWVLGDGDCGQAHDERFLAPHEAWHVDGRAPLLARPLRHIDVDGIAPYDGDGYVDVDVAPRGRAGVRQQEIPVLAIEIGDARHLAPLARPLE